nr:hypothetical protein [uncultured Sphingomonas sp.]
MKFPSGSNELLEEIQKLVPERLPNEGETMESYQRYAGKRELVLHLIHARDASRRADARVPSPRKR